MNYKFILNLYKKTLFSKKKKNINYQYYKLVLLLINLYKENIQYYRSLPPSKIEIYNFSINFYLILFFGNSNSLLHVYALGNLSMLSIWLIQILKFLKPS